MSLLCGPGSAIAQPSAANRTTAQPSAATRARSTQRGFAALDRNRTNNISRSELWQGLGRLFSKWKPGTTFVDPIARTGIRKAWDLDKNGDIDLIEFASGRRIYVSKKGKVNLESNGRGKTNLVYGLLSSTKNATGAIRKNRKISRKQLKGYRVAEGLLRALDKNKDGLLSRGEWP